MNNSRRTNSNTSTKQQHTTAHNNSHSSIENYQNRIKFGNTLSQHNKASPPPSTHDGGSSSDDSEHINMDKLKLIKTRAAQRFSIIFFCFHLQIYNKIL